MSVKPNKKPSFALGLILILLLLAAVILGGSWVVRQAFLPRQSDARPAAAAVSGQPDAAAQLPVQTAEETVSGAQPVRRPSHGCRRQQRRGVGHDVAGDADQSGRE